MRPQQNRRMRGRGNNNRRGPNPLTRNYESNGPDVKIRGNAQHIADKYTTLARDAQAAGDRVMAENYLQHAEHYMRIILSAQSQMSQPLIRDDAADDDMEDSGQIDLAESAVSQPAGSGPQPVIDDMPAELAFPAHAVSAFEADSEESLKADRPRRPTRRRLPRKAETAPAGAPTTNGRSMKNTNPENAGSEAESEAAEKPRRGRRSIKAEKTEEIEQADA